MKNYKVSCGLSGEKFALILLKSVMGCYGNNTLNTCRSYLINSHDVINLISTLCSFKHHRSSLKKNEPNIVRLRKKICVVQVT